MQACGEDRVLLRLAIRRHTAEDVHLSGLSLHNENVAIGREAHHPWHAETIGKKADVETRGRRGH